MSGLLGLHRYEVAQGFQPDVMRFAGRSPAEVLVAAVAVMGAQPAHVVVLG